MKTLSIIGAGLTALIASASIAQAAPNSRQEAPRPEAPKTRVELQKHVAERFAKWDTNRDGKVTKAEFDAVRAQRMAEWKGKAEERRGERFAMIDANKDGQLSRDEFAAAHGPRDGKRGPAMHRGIHRGPGGPGGFGGRGMAFERMDANKDGVVTLAEASAKPLERFNAVDTNKDGTISPAERDAAWKARRGGPNA